MQRRFGKKQKTVLLNKNSPLKIVVLSSFFQFFPDQLIIALMSFLDLK